MSVSTIPALRTALLARLAAETWPTATPQILRSHPYPVLAENEMIYLAGTQNSDPIGSLFGGGQRPAAIGQRKQEERYVQTVIVSVIGNAMADVAVQEARAFQLAGVIETSVRNWATTSPSAYDGVVRWCFVSGLRLDSAHLVAAEGGQSPSSREILITIDLACTARI